MESGAQVWVHDSESNAWLAAAVVLKNVKEDGSVTVHTKTDVSGEEFSFRLTDDNEERDDIKLANSVDESAAENLIVLPYLHEPAILYCLELRYAQCDIYTYTGPILIAMNPFKRISLYTNQILEMYYNLGLLKAQGVENAAATPLPPHVYAIADAAYRDMMNVLTVRNSKMIADQAILISGESGAGKTESTKIVLRYLTTVGNAGGTSIATGSVMDKILQSNPILEAFGNAKTLRNDNSSRFGKFIELNFTKRGHLIAGNIKTYLLEKVRLPNQQKGERNFHIFYQMCAGASAEDRQRWKLLDMTEFSYTSQGEVYQLPHVNDVEEYEDMRKSMSTLNFSGQDQVSLLNIAAGLLHLGQLHFMVDDSGEGSVVSPDEKVMYSLQAAADLFGVTSEELGRSITTRVIIARNESYVKPLTPPQAADARDALAKAIYGLLFEWIVGTINMSICADDSSLIKADIGVLDIFGFECFKSNSFEQLCINFTNEMLQQQFNQFVFKYEQIEYEREHIEWSFIEFPDNQDCLDLIEHRSTGILAILDDECKVPRATDEKFAAHMYRSLIDQNSHPRFSATVAQKRDSKFCIRHYAGSVIYSATTFIDKNKDELPKEATSLFQMSSVALLSRLFIGGGLDNFHDSSLKEKNASTKRQSIVNATPAAVTNASSKGKASVSAQFKIQLHQLMDEIAKTKPHYIRCLKPNDENVPDNFNRVRITEQLRYGGVLEAVRVARSGFPVRLVHGDFYARYRPLANPFSELTATLPRVLSTDADHRNLCEQLLESLWDEYIPPEEESSVGVQSVIASSSAARAKLNRRSSRIGEIVAWKGKGTIAKESVQLGLTKVFLRKSAHDLLESRRSRRLLAAAKKIQCHFRRHCIHRWYLNTIKAIKKMQHVLRRLMVLRKEHKIRCTHAAIKLQTASRRFTSLLRYKRFQWGVLRLQSGFRAKLGYRLYLQVRLAWRSVRLQRVIRGLVMRHKFQWYRKSVISLQCGWRMIGARRLLKQLRIEARDVGNLKQSNEALKAEIEKLRTKAQEETLRVEKEIVEVVEREKAVALEKIQEELDTTKVLLAEEQKLRETAEMKLANVENNAPQNVSDASGELKRMQDKYDKDMKISADKEKKMILEHQQEIEQLMISGAVEGAPRMTGLSNEDSSVDDFFFPATEGPPAEGGVTSPASPAAPAEYEALVEEMRKERQAKQQMAAEMAKVKADCAAQIADIKARAQLEESPIPERKPDAMPARRSSGSSINGVADVTPKRHISGRTADSSVIVSSNADFATIAMSMSNANTPMASRVPSASGKSSKKSSGRIKIGKTPNSTASKMFAAASTTEFSDDEGDDEDDDASMSSRSVTPPPDTHRAPKEKDHNETWHSVSGPVAAKRHSLNLSKDLPAGTSERRPSASDKVTATRAALGVFEKNIENFKTKLKLGLSISFWEFKGKTGANAQTWVRTEGQLKMQEEGIIAFNAKRGIMNVWSYKSDIKPIAIVDIAEIQPGAYEIMQGHGNINEAFDDSVMMTIICKPVDLFAPRLVIMGFVSHDERTSFLTGLRSMTSELHMKTESLGASMRDGIISDHEAVLKQKKMDKDAAAKPVLARYMANTASEPTNPMVTPKRKSGVSIDDSPMHLSTPATSAAGVDAVRRRSSLTTMPSMVHKPSFDTPNPHIVHLEHKLNEQEQLIKDITKQMHLEKSNYEKLMVQMLILTNDLNDREDQIIALKKKEQAMDSHWSQREKLFEQDAAVRMQLGQKLQNVLMDKEDAMEQCDIYKEELDQLRQSIAMGMTLPTEPSISKQGGSSFLGRF